MTLLCTVGLIKRKLINLAGAKESSQGNENVSSMMVCFDLFPVQAKQRSVSLALGQMALCTQIPVVTF
jgi:hypothetical protein